MKITYWVAQFEDGFYYNEKLFRVANVALASVREGYCSKNYVNKYFSKKIVGKNFEVFLIEREI